MNGTDDPDDLAELRRAITRDGRISCWHNPYTMSWLVRRVDRLNEIIATMLTHTMPDLRAAVLAEMARREWSSYALVQALKGKRPGGKDVPAATIYEFLRGETTINSNDLGLIFDALGLEPRRKTRK